MLQLAKIWNVASSSLALAHTSSGTWSQVSLISRSARLETNASSDGIVPVIKALPKTSSRSSVGIKANSEAIVAVSIALLEMSITKWFRWYLYYLYYLYYRHTKDHSNAAWLRSRRHLRHILRRYPNLHPGDHYMTPCILRELHSCGPSLTMGATHATASFILITSSDMI